MSKLLFIIALIAATFQTTAKADNENPMLLPVGEQEALMGNTGVALGGSPANAIYNPAGIAQLTTKRLTVSGSTYGLIKAKMETTGNDDLTFTTFNAVPNMVVGSRQLNKWTVTYGIFSPSALEIDADYKTYFEELSGNGRMNFNSKIEEQYIGGGSARDVGNGWTVGFSLFAHRFHERSASSTQITPAGAVGPTSPYVAQGEKVEFEVISALAIIGAQYRWTDDLNWGVTVRLPNMQVYDVSTVYSEVLYYNGTVVAKQLLDQKDQGANYELPTEIGTGVHYKLSGGHELTVDLHAQDEGSYTTIPGSAKGKHVRLGRTARGSVGYGYPLNPNTQVLVGLNWNPSTVRSKVNVENGEGEPPNNFILVSGGVHHHTDNVTTSGGFFYGVSRTDRDFFGGKADDSTSLQAIGMIISSSITY